MASRSIPRQRAAIAALVLLSTFLASPARSADDSPIRSAQASAASATALQSADGMPERTCKVRKLVQRGAPGKSVPMWQPRVVPCEKA